MVGRKAVAKSKVMYVMLLTIPLLLLQQYPVQSSLAQQGTGTGVLFTIAQVHNCTAACKGEVVQMRLA